MKVYEEKAKLVLPKSHGRSEGLHISEVIRDYALCSKTLDKKWVTTMLLEDQNTNLMQVGLAFEDYLAAHQHPEIEYHPGELFLDDDEFCTCSHELDEHDGDGICAVEGCVCEGFKALRIFMSPDGISSVDPDDYADLFALCGHFIHEFKFTKKSSNEFLQSIRTRAKVARMWLWQIMCYCHASSTLAAKLHVMFINGNYRRDDKDPESAPSYKVFRLEFEQQDLDDNWELFRNHAREMRKR